MLLGTNYAEDRLYRGIKHYDHLPLTSEDLHEYADTSYVKNAIIMNSILGSGVLNKPDINISSQGIRFNSPLHILVDGDVAMIQSDNGVPIVSMKEIQDAGYTDGLVCVVGWYQFLNHNSTLRSYGGVKNSVIENNLFNNDLNMQVSTRYQFRWDTVIIENSITDDSMFSFSLLNRDEKGDITSGTTNIDTISHIEDVRIANKPSNMGYAVSDLYIVPVLSYNYENSKINSADTFSTRKSKSTASNISLKQYSNYITMTEELENTSSSKFSIGIDGYSKGDMLQVIYEGLLLTEGKHYIINSDNTVTLLDFSTRVGDILTFIVVKIEDRR